MCVLKQIVETEGIPLISYSAVSIGADNPSSLLVILFLKTMICLLIYTKTGLVFSFSKNQILVAVIPGLENAEDFPRTKGAEDFPRTKGAEDFTRAKLFFIFFQKQF
jgi:hypothetical protein